MSWSGTAKVKWYLDWIYCSELTDATKAAEYHNSKWPHPQNGTSWTKQYGVMISHQCIHYM